MIRSLPEQQRARLETSSHPLRKSPAISTRENSGCSRFTAATACSSSAGGEGWGVRGSEGWGDRGGGVGGKWGLGVLVSKLAERSGVVIWRGSCGDLGGGGGWGGGWGCGRFWLRGGEVVFGSRGVEDSETNRPETGVSKTLRSRATVLFHKLPVIHAEPTTNSSPPRDTQMPRRLSRNVWCV